MKKVPQLSINFRNMTETESVIDIDGEIGWINEEGEWNTASNIKNQLRQLSEMKTKRIVVNIHSSGGFVDDGLAIHDALASHSAEVETVVYGMTASAATIIAQAGDVRKMSKNALYLVHKAWNFVIGNENDLLTALEDVRMVDERIADIYARRSGKDKEYYTSLMNEKDGRGIWLDSTTALEHGLIDEEVEPMKAAASVDASMFNGAFMPDLPEDADVDVDVDVEEDTSNKFTVTIKAEKVKEIVDTAINKLRKELQNEEKTASNEGAGLELLQLKQELTEVEL